MPADAASRLARRTATRTASDTARSAWRPLAAATLGGAGLASSTRPITVVSGAVPAGAVQNLQVSLTLPDQTETTVNGRVPAANTVQGLSTAITWTFSESQRTGATTSS